MKKGYKFSSPPLIWALTSFKVANSKHRIFNSVRYLSSVKADTSYYSLEENLRSWLRRYEDLFGITKLAEMHDNVLKVQSRVQDIQQKRRKVQEDALIVQNKLQEIQTKLEKIPRGDDMFLSIVTQEHELIKEQKHLQNLLSVYDRTEREEQTALALAINNSQDHERTYREKNKYLSLITGVVGGLIGVIGSSINNWRHRKDIKVFANEISTLIENQSNEPKVILDSDTLLNIRNLSKNIDILFTPASEIIFEDLKNHINEFIVYVQAQEAALENISKNVQSFISNDGTNLTNEEFYSNIFMKKIMMEVDSHVEKEVKHKVYIPYIISTCILSALLLYLINK